MGAMVATTYQSMLATPASAAAPHAPPRGTAALFVSARSFVIPFIIAVLLLGAGTALLQSLNRQQAANRQVIEAFERRETLDGTLQLLVDAETGQRGYLLTGNPIYLQPYRHAEAELPGNLRALRRLGLLPAGGEVDRLIAARMALIDRSVALGLNGRREEATDVVASGEGKRLLDRIRRAIADHKAYELQRATAALASAQRGSTLTYGLLALLAAGMLALAAAGFRRAVRTTRLRETAQRLAEVEQSQRETALVARELNHRVKNLFAVVLAIIQLGARGATSAPDAVERIRSRVQALARAHEISLGRGVVHSVELASLVRATLEPYRRGEDHLEITGAAVELPVMRVTPLGMIIHELATNAVKYGAWSSEAGKVRIHWTCEDGVGANRSLVFRWEESGAPPPDEQAAKGFGTKLIDSAVGQLGGTIRREWRSDGVAVVLDAPIVEAQPDAE